MKTIILLILLILSSSKVYAVNQAWTVHSAHTNQHRSSASEILQKGETYNLYTGDVVPTEFATPYTKYDEYVADFTITLTSSCNNEKKYYYYTAPYYTGFIINEVYQGSPVLCCPVGQHVENGICVEDNSCQDWTDILVDNVETTYPAGNTCVPRDDYGCLAIPNGGIGVIYINSAGVKMEIGTYKYTGAMCDPNSPEFNPPENPIVSPVDPINNPGGPAQNPISDQPGIPMSPDIAISGIESGSTGNSMTSTVLNGDGTTTTTTNGTISNSGTGQGMTGSGLGYSDSSYNHIENVDPVTQQKTELDTWNSGTSKYEPPERIIDFTGMNEQLERLSASGPVQLFNILKNIVSTLSGTPQAPEFTFNVGHHDFNVSLERFDTVALIFRSFMAIIIAIGTIYFIFKQWGVTS